MYKVLIYLNENELASRGGPLGYNYNLKKGLEMTGGNFPIHIDFLPGSTVRNDVNNYIEKVRNKKLRKFIACIKSIYTKGGVLYWGNHKSEKDLSYYDAVHFHSTYDLYKVRNSLKNYKGKVILTPHTPTKPSKEIFDNLSRFERVNMRGFYKALDDIDEYAFELADYYIFPCEESEEPYYNNWPGFQEIKEKHKDKFYYNPTGIIEQTAKISREEIRDKYGIPQEAKLVCYVGRHNEIKGYSDLKKIGEKVLTENKNAYFLIAGREEPLKKLDHDRWLETGWTNDPGSIIQAADVFVLPNRETYFDLVLLEALSLGQVVLATRTGGNRYFEKKGCKGVRLYNTFEEGYASICEFFEMPEEQIDKLRKSNREFYEKEFTVDLFTKRYLRILEAILQL